MFSKLSKFKIMTKTNDQLNDGSRFMPFMPAEVLYDLDGPRIFTFLDRDNDKFFAYEYEESEDGFGYIVVPTSDAILESLKSGRITVRKCLDQPRIWIVRLGEDGAITSARKIVMRDIPDKWLPGPRVMLWASLQPFFSVRLSGPDAEGYGTLAGVIRTAAEGAEGALKRLVEIAQQRRRTQGRPTNEIKRYYNLPLQTFGFSSFEISFRPPVPDEGSLLPDVDKEIIDEMSILLSLGIGIVRGTTARAEHPELSDEDYRSLLETIKLLTPSTQGGLEEIEISGSLLGKRSNPESLTRDSRIRLNRAIKATQPVSMLEESIVVIGNIEVADKGKYLFKLRNIHGRAAEEEIEFSFRAHLYNDVMDAFGDGGLYRVYAVRSPKEPKPRATNIDLA